MNENDSIETSINNKFGQNGHSGKNFSIDDEMLEITTDARRDVSDLIDRSQGSKNLMEIPLIEDSSTRTHYDDFHTIDWLKDLARDRFRHRIIQKKKKGKYMATNCYSTRFMVRLDLCSISRFIVWSSCCCC